MTMSNIAQHPVQMASISNRQILAAVSASCLGWALDLFDLFVLLYVAPVIGKLFFPSTHAMLSLAAPSSAQQQAAPASQQAPGQPQPPAIAAQAAPTVQETAMPARVEVNTCRMSVHGCSPR